MTSVCTLTGIVSYFQCGEGVMPFTELLTVVFFIIFFFILKGFGWKEAAPPALLLCLIVAVGFVGMGVMNTFSLVLVVTFLGVVSFFLYNQNHG